MKILVFINENSDDEFDVIDNVEDDLMHSEIIDYIDNIYGPDCWFSYGIEYES